MKCWKLGSGARVDGREVVGQTSMKEVRVAGMWMGMVGVNRVRKVV